MRSRHGHFSASLRPPALVLATLRRAAGHASLSSGLIARDASSRHSSASLRRLIASSLATSQKNLLGRLAQLINVASEVWALSFVARDHPLYSVSFSSRSSSGFSYKTAFNKERCTSIFPLLPINPSLRNLFRKKLTRDRVVPIISAKVA